MRILLMSSMLLSMVFLSGCYKFPEIKPFERCVMSIDLEACRCHEYTISKDTIGRTSHSTSYPVGYCTQGKVVVFKVKTWGKIYNWLIESRDWLTDSRSEGFIEDL